MEQKADRRKYIIIILVLLLFGAILYIIFAQNPKTLLAPDQSAVTFSGFRKTQSKSIEQRGIAIPGLESLVFVADQKEQKVNFFNPAENEGILIALSLVVDDAVLWQSGNIEAGKGYYDIELSEPLKAGTYDAYLVYDCFTSEGIKLNSAQVKFTLYVQEK